MNYYICALIFLTLIVGCSSTTIKTLETNDMRECAQNFTYKGTFLSGRTYTTFSFVNNVSVRKAMERATQHMVNDGWSILSTDEKSGVISATQKIDSKRVNTVPLSVAIESKDRGVKIAITYFLAAGLTATLESIKDNFCSTIEAVSI